jgi:hypothetical protein
MQRAASGWEFSRAASAEELGFREFGKIPRGAKEIRANLSCGAAR